MSTPALETTSFDVADVRRDFPILNQQIHGKPLVYFDNAATAQKPIAVLDTLQHYYREYNANVHRGVHTLSEHATAAYEGARDKVASFMNAPSRREIIFVRGTTEAINLVAQSYARPILKPGDEIIVSRMAHHSNIVPWILLRDELDIELRVIPINERGELELEVYEQLFSPRTRLVAVGHVSNALGTVNPVERIVATARKHDVPVLIDGAQRAPHAAIDVQALDCDFYAFSSHKAFGPTGVGALWARENLLETMPPYQGGGEMIKMVSFERVEYNDLPHRFEAGTPNIAGAVGLGAAIDYLNGLGYERIGAWESQLRDYATERLSEIPGLRIIGTAAEKVSVISFVMDGIHPHDLGTIVDHEGIAIRTGHHCAMPIMDYFGVPATARASLAFYNTLEEIDCLVDALTTAREVFA